MSHGEHATDQCRIRFILGQTADEGLIDLYDLSGYLFEIRETAVARPEIVNGTDDPELADFGQIAQDLCPMADQPALCELYF